MTTYIEYDLGNGNILLVESSDRISVDAFRASSTGGNVVKKAEISFHQALENVKTSAMILLSEFADVEADEIEITFGLNTMGEMGNFAVGKVGLGANYELKMKWKRPENNKK